MMGHKKIWVSMVAMFLVLCFFDQNASAATKKPYTVLIYLNGTDLESEGAAATADLQELMTIGSQKNMNVIVETGGTKKWYTKGISNKVNQRWIIQKGKMKLVKTLTKQNMGKPATLTNFLTWGMKAYPADRYAVVFWDHGGGSVAGFGSDELFNNDSLTLDELETALKNTKKQTNKKIELVGFDACLMSTIETANLLTPYGNYLVASQELEPGHGWNYKELLSAINKTPKITGDKLGKAIADGFMQQAKAEGTDDQITLAVTNLNKIPNVVTALNNFSKQVTTTLATPAQLVQFGQARAKSREFSSTGMVDLADLATKSSSQYAQLANNLNTAINKAVAYKVASPAYKDVKGLSIYFPANNVNDELTDYKIVDFSKDYKGLLARYYTTSANQKEISFDQTITEVPSEQADEKIFQVKIADEDIERISEVYSVIGIEEEDRFYYLGIDNDVTFNRDTGIIEDNFTWETLALDDYYISIFFDHETDDYARYTIPAVLNGEEVELIVIYDYTNLDEDGYAYAEIIGAWSGVDEETGLAARDLIQIKQGDKVTPLIYYYDYSKEDYGYEEWGTLTVGKDFGLYSYDLEAESENYVYGFYAVDYLGNIAQSDYYDLTMD